MKCAVLLLLVSQVALGALAPGDIAVIGMNCDNPDTIAFVALKALPAGEEIRFTDCGWTSGGAFRPNEGGVKYTVPAGGIAAGTVVVQDSPFTTGAWTVDNEGFNANLAFSTSGDQTLVFQGASGSPSHIFAVNDRGSDWQATADNSNDSALPSGLINGATAVAANEADNIKYNGITTGTRAELLAAICNQANWVGDNSSRYTSFPTFTVTDGGGDDPNISVAPSLSFGAIMADTVATQSLLVANTGISNALTVYGVAPAGGDTDKFTVLSFPGTVPASSSGQMPVLFTPGAAESAAYTAMYALTCNDPSDPTNMLTFSGGTLVGLITISNIQYTTTGDSPYLGQEVGFSGVCCYADSSGYVLSEPEGGHWNAVYVYDFYHRPEIGDEVLVRGTVDEYFSFTEVQNVVYYQVLSHSNSVAPIVLTAPQIKQEAFEAVLVCVSNVTVSDENIGGTGFEWEIQDNAGRCMVDDNCPYRYIWKLNQHLDAVYGCVWYSFDNFKLEPRYDDDFVGRPVMEYALRGLVMTPEGPRSNWYVQVWDDDIVAVTAAAPAGVTVVNTDGIIFPGLIDAHNHPSYNSFPTLMFYNFPFGHRDQWGSDAEYNLWKSKRSVVRNNAAVDDSNTDTVTKYGECLELMAGCVTIQGQSNNKLEHSHPDVILYNVEEFPSRIAADIFPWEMSSGERENLRKQIEGGAVNAALIHLSEGPDEVSRAQFDTWYNWGMLDETTAIIHGTPYKSNELSKIAAAGAKIVWAPMSNMKLYGSTLDIKLARQYGVLVGLSPDWTPSGCYNLLEELGYAWTLNTGMYDSAYTPREMCAMVTSNNAAACGLAQRYGMLKPGYNAGLCVIAGDQADPYMALITARPKDVKLTVVDGMPRYGDPGLMMALGVTGEYVTVCATQKMMNVAVDHPFLNDSDATFATLRSRLQTGHATLFPEDQLYGDELQFLNLKLLQCGPDTVPPFHADNPLTAPANGTEFTVEAQGSLSFLWKHFWDNLSANQALVHREIAIVPFDNQSVVMQVVASNVPNTPASQTVDFTVGFVHGGDHVFRFVTQDEQGNVRTAVVGAVKFTVVPEPGVAAALALAIAVVMRARRALI